MSSKRIVITGAHSYIGRNLVDKLLKETDWAIGGIVTPWARAGQTMAEVPDRYRVMAADLAEPLPPEAATWLAEADMVVHVAWVRGPDVRRSAEVNGRVVENLIDAKSENAGIIFMSSVSASPDAEGFYGRSKWAVGERIVEADGVALVVGLVHDMEPGGPYAALSAIPEKLPVRARTFWGDADVYTTRLDDLMTALRQAIENPPAAGRYRCFGPGPNQLNEILGAIERRHPRFRIPLPLPARPIRWVMRGGRAVHAVPAGIADRFLTLLYTDPAPLQDLPPLPGVTFAPYPI